MISDEVWDQAREAWLASIPKPYRYTGRERKASNVPDGAIILPPPAAPLLQRWLEMVCERHLTQDQLQSRAVRENCGRPGVKKGDSWSPLRRERNRTRAKPSKPSLPPALKADSLEEFMVLSPIAESCRKSPDLSPGAEAKAPATR